MDNNIRLTMMDLLLEDIVEPNYLSVIDEDLESAIKVREDAIKRQQEELEAIKRYKSKVLNKLRLILSVDKTEGEQNE